MLRKKKNQYPLSIPQDLNLAKKFLFLLPGKDTELLIFLPHLHAITRSRKKCTFFIVCTKDQLRYLQEFLPEENIFSFHREDNELYSNEIKRICEILKDEQIDITFYTDTGYNEGELFILAKIHSPLRIGLFSDEVKDFTNIHIKSKDDVRELAIQYAGFGSLFDIDTCQQKFFWKNTHHDKEIMECFSENKLNKEQHIIGIDIRSLRDLDSSWTEKCIHLLRTNCTAQFYLFTDTIESKKMFHFCSSFELPVFYFKTLPQLQSAFRNTTLIITAISAYHLICHQMGVEAIVLASEDHDERYISKNSSFMHPVIFPNRPGEESMALIIEKTSEILQYKKN